jgi:hypothetical protein
MDAKMKTGLLLLLVAAALGGCVIAPVGYGDGRGDYYGERTYDRSDSRYPNQHHDGYRGSGNYGDNQYYRGHDH